jgi:hypothetical protein
MGTKQTCEKFSPFGYAGTSVEDVSIQVFLPQATKKRDLAETLHNLQRSPTKYYFRDRWQVRPLIWILSAKFKGKLEHSVDGHEVCASVAHRRRETVACLSARK